jgi:hypothetical protein
VPVPGGVRTVILFGTECSHECRSPFSAREGLPLAHLWGQAQAQPWFLTKSEMKGTSTHSPWYDLMPR